MNGKMIQFVDSIIYMIRKKNNPIVKLDLDSIIKNKINLFFILVFCVQLY